MVQQDLAESGVEDFTAEYGEKLIEREHCAYLRPMVVHADSPDRQVAVQGIHVPLRQRGAVPAGRDVAADRPHAWWARLLTQDQSLIEAAGICVEIDRLNVGPIPTNRLNWLQPHEGNIIDFLFRSRAYQIADMPVAASH